MASTCPEVTSPLISVRSAWALDPLSGPNNAAVRKTAAPSLSCRTDERTERKEKTILLTDQTPPQQNKECLFQESDRRGDALPRATPCGGDDGYDVRAMELIFNNS